MRAGKFRLAAKRSASNRVGMTFPRLFGLLLTGLVVTASLVYAGGDTLPTPVPYKREAHFSKKWDNAPAPAKPATIFMPAPLRYPKEFLKWGQPAFAVVEFVVLETGRPDQIQCTEATDKAFAKSAIWTIEHSIYTPAIVNQQGVASRHTQRLDFKLKAKTDEMSAEQAKSEQTAGAAAH